MSATWATLGLGVAWTFGVPLLTGAGWPSADENVSLTTSGRWPKNLPPGAPVDFQA